VEVVDVAKLKADWSGIEFDSVDVEAKGDSMLAFAKAVGEQDPRFCDPTHADYQAPVTFTAKYVGKRMFPKGFPKIGSGMGFDAGKCVEVHAPIRPGDHLTAKSQIHDIYEKSGRSGPMVFIVHRMEFYNQKEQLVSIVDWRLVMQPEKTIQMDVKGVGEGKGSQ